MPIDQPNEQSDQNSPTGPVWSGRRWKRLKTDFLNVVGHGLANSRSTYWRFRALEAYPVQPLGAYQQGSDYDQMMRAAGVVLDTSGLDLLAPDIENFISRHVPIPADFMEIVASPLGLKDVDVLSHDLADAALLHPQLVRFAISGRLASAVLAMPAVDATDNEGSRFTKEMEEKLFMLLVELAAWHQLIGLCRAGRNARRRYYKPTGIPVFDRQKGNRATTVANVGRQYAYRAARVETILGFYATTKFRDLRPDEEQQIISIPGLVSYGRQEEARLRAEFGDDLPAIVDGWHRTARIGNRYVRRRTSAFLRNAHGNKTLTKEQGEEALVLLFLSCLQVSAWLVVTPDESSTEKHDKINNVDQDKFNLIYRALKQIRGGITLEPVVMPDRANPIARELFFLIRNLITNVKGAHGFIGRTNGRINLGKVEKAYWKQDARRGKDWVAGKSYILGNEPFAADAIEGFRKVHDDAEAQGNAPLLEEVRGPIWRQLHL